MKHSLDPRSRRELWTIVRELVADGVTILLTTQYLEEADQLADRIAVLDGGRIVAEDTPAELKRLIPGWNRWRTPWPSGSAGSWPRPATRPTNCGWRRC